MFQVIKRGEGKGRERKGREGRKCWKIMLGLWPLVGGGGCSKCVRLIARVCGGVRGEGAQGARTPLSNWINSATLFCSELSSNAWVNWNVYARSCNRAITGKMLASTIRCGTVLAF